jgi:hypothetical protein
MRALTITATIAAAAIALLASPGAIHHPLAAARDAEAAVPAADPGAEPVCAEQQQPDGAARKHVSDISWFQGTLEEAFTRHTHTDHRPWLHF